MIIKNKLDKTFGPSASFSGYFMMAIGIFVVITHSITGLILVLIGAFTAFTNTSAFIDIENKKVRFTNNLFGLISVGKWISINPGMKFALKKTNRVYKAHSRSNRTVSLSNKDIRLILFNANNKQIMTIKKFNDIEIAREELKKVKASCDIE